MTWSMFDGLGTRLRHYVARHPWTCTSLLLLFTLVVTLTCFVIARADEVTRTFVLRYEENTPLVLDPTCTADTAPCRVLTGQDGEEGDEWTLEVQTKHGHGAVLTHVRTGLHLQPSRGRGTPALVDTRTPTAIHDILIMPHYGIDGLRIQDGASRDILAVGQGTDQVVWAAISQVGTTETRADWTQHFV